VDKKTIQIYNEEAQTIAQLHSNLVPTRIYELITLFFQKGKVTVDIGCGIGRDTFWLNKRKYPTLGVDGSIGMLNEARQLYKELNFIEDFLPDLINLKNQKFQNILCSAVLMHLDATQIEKACYRLLEILENDGILIISIRGTNETNNRENGKLYQDINIDNFFSLFKEKGCSICLHETDFEKKRNLTWHNLVIKKFPALAE